MKHIISAGGIIPRKRNDALFILFITTKEGLLSFPKGHVRAAESIDDAALREVKEETGFNSVRIIHKLGVVHREGTEPGGGKSNKDIHFFLMDVAGYDGLNDEEIRWVEFGEALGQMKWSGERQFLIQNGNVIEEYLAQKENQPRKIVVLEGLPASGKTSLADYLRNNFHFLKVNESLGHLGGINASNDQRVIFNETLKKYSFAQRSTVDAVIDRGYPSMLAWDYCAEKLQRAHDLDEKMLWVAQALKKGELFEPDLYVYVSIPYELSFARRRREEVDTDIWSGIYGLKHCEEYYGAFFEDPSIKMRSCVIEGTLPVSQIAQVIFSRTEAE